jgi:hypothetical protein
MNILLEAVVEVFQHVMITSIGHKNEPDGILAWPMLTER